VKIESMLKYGRCGSFLADVANKFLLLLAILSFVFGATHAQEPASGAV